MSSSEQIEQTKQQIRGLVSEIAQLAKSDLGAQEFYAAFLQRVVSAVAAVGGAIWILGESKRLELAYQINLSDTLLAPEEEDSQRHMRLLTDVMRSGEPQLVPPLSGPTDDESSGNPTHYLLVLNPLTSDGRLEGVVEIFQRPDSQPATQRGYLRFLNQMCELAGDWLKSQKLKQFSDRHSLWAQADHYSRLVHESLDLRETCYTAVNEGRRLIGCDRVSVAIKRGRKCVIEAVSGQDTLENRSNIIAALGNLATRVVATGEPLWYEGLTEDLPPQVEHAIEDYVEESYSKAIVVLPLREPDNTDNHDHDLANFDPNADHRADREVIGALIVEQIETELPREVITPRIDLAYEHTARAVSNSLQHNSMFLMPVWKMLGKTKIVTRARTLPKTLAVAAIVLLVVICLVAVPADFKLESKGTLQPVVKRNVYTDLKGIVVDVKKKHGEPVEKGEVLAVLTNVDLKVQLEDVRGELLATRERLVSVQSALLGRTLSRQERNQRIGELAQLQKTIASLETQQRLLEQKEESLQIRSPITGQVITWDVSKLLMNRPVEPGQVLLTIADPKSNWELELNMPERRMGHVTRAQREFKKTDLDVDYILTTDPGEKRHGHVKEVNNRTDMHDEDGHTVRIQVDIKKSDLVDPRPGSTVTAEIHCGRRPLGYVWFHEMFEWVQTNLLF